jgi:hypothetical protein
MVIVIYVLFMTGGSTHTYHTASEYRKLYFCPKPE